MEFSSRTRQEPPAPLFPQLSGGPSDRSRQEVARHQRRRLQGAMLEATYRYGYGETTLRELVALAGVSRSTFYEHFESKEDCFLATFDDVIGRATELVGNAYRTGDDVRGRLRTALEAFVEIIVAEPAAASLIAVESLSLGAAGVAPRERAAAAFERLFARTFEEAPGGGEVSAETTRAVVTGIRRIVYRCLRNDQTELLRDYIDPLLDWALSYQQPPHSDLLASATAAAAVPQAASGEFEALPEWSAPDRERSRFALDQRERILRAAAQIAVAKSYSGLSIPAISGAAGISNQTFYEYFESKEEAFLAAFDSLALQAFEVTNSAFAAQDEPAAAVGAAVRALLEFIAANPLFARLAFFELPTAGPKALDQADQTTAKYVPFLSSTARGAAGRPVEEVIAEAIGGGVWGVIQYEIARGRESSLPRLAPEILTIALTPFVLQ